MVTLVMRDKTIYLTTLKCYYDTSNRNAPLVVLLSLLACNFKI